MYFLTGERGTLYLGALDYSQEFPKIGQLSTQMKENEYISFVDSWYDLMVTYTMQDTGIGKEIVIMYVLLMN